jgi:hypothetical protein
MTLLLLFQFQISWSPSTFMNLLLFSSFQKPFFGQIPFFSLSTLQHLPSNFMTILLLFQFQISSSSFQKPFFWQIPFSFSTLRHLPFNFITLLLLFLFQISSSPSNFMTLLLFSSFQNPINMFWPNSIFIGEG